jgi:hypothetical protein
MTRNIISTGFILLFLAIIACSNERGEMITLETSESQSQSNLSLNPEPTTTTKISESAKSVATTIPTSVPTYQPTPNSTPIPTKTASTIPKTTDTIPKIPVATKEATPETISATQIPTPIAILPTLESEPAETKVPNPTPNPFKIVSQICTDESGSDCSQLRLGDDYLTTTAPEKGYLYSCNAKNPNAPGSNTDKLTWVDFARNTWDFFEKLWLPEGSFKTPAGTYKETVADNTRTITSNNLPVDGKIGDWPMSDYPILTEIDRNPGIPSSGQFSASYPTDPSEADSPSCVSLGPIGITKNGVVIYNAADARGEDAVAKEIVDIFGGHPAMTDYHYHFIPERLDNKFLSDGHSDVVGYINDGFPIHGYKGSMGIEMTNKDLDMCHGHNHGALGYHYHATIEYPYTVGCYFGIPASGGQVPRQSNMDVRNEPPNRNPDLFRAASILGVPEETLRSALGPPPPNLPATAGILGISEEILRAALESSR